MTDEGAPSSPPRLIPSTTPPFTNGGCKGAQPPAQQSDLPPHISFPVALTWTDCLGLTFLAAATSAIGLLALHALRLPVIAALRTLSKSRRLIYLPLSGVLCTALALACNLFFRVPIEWPRTVAISFATPLMLLWLVVVLTMLRSNRALSQGHA